MEPPNPNQKPRVFSQSEGRENWKSDLKKYLKIKIIPTILPKVKGESETIQKQRDAMVSDKAMDIWVSVFTHPSFKPKVNTNFEVHEFLGDKMLNFTLGDYIKRLHPNSTQENLNNFVTSYSERRPLAIIAREKGMNNYLRTLMKIQTTKEKSDIVEAVIGGIMKVTEKLISPVLSMPYAFNYVVSLFNWIRTEFPEAKGKSGVINQVGQDYYDTLGWKRTDESIKDFERTEDVERDDGATDKKLTIILPNAAIVMLRGLDISEEKIGVTVQIGKNKEEGVLAFGIGDDKPAARLKAYKRGLDKLIKIFDLTPDKVRDMGLRIFLEKNIENKKEAKALYKKISDKNKAQAVKWMKQDIFTDSIKGKQVYGLLGYNDSGVTGVLYRIMFSENPKLKKFGYTDDNIRVLLYSGYANRKDPLGEFRYIYYEVKPKNDGDKR